MPAGISDKDIYAVMLRKNYDLAIVGKSFFHYIFALDSVDEKKKILLLEDERLSFGVAHTQGISDIERFYLQTFGEDFDVWPLKQLDSYVKQKSVLYVWRGKRVLLGRDPWSNLIELYRKVPELFPWEDFVKTSGISREEFNEEVLKYLHGVGKASCLFKTLQSVDQKFLLEGCPHFILELFELFKNASVEREDLSRSFFYHFRGFCHKAFLMAHNEFEVFHLFLSLLARSYVIFEDKLMNDLTPVIVERGVDYKETKVRDWKFFNSRPWSVELDSFEGIIHPEKVVFIGGTLKELRLKTKVGSEYYECVHFKVPVREGLLLSKENLTVRYADDKMMGAHICAWQFDSIKNNVIQGFCVYRKHKGTKVSLVHNELTEAVLKVLASWCHIQKDDVITDGIEFQFGKEFYPDNSFTYKSLNISRHTDVKVYDYTSPIVQSHLKNVLYLGPFKRNTFGTYGQLLELKEGRYFH